jgi:Domain of unknown function (DUF4349)
MTTIDEEALSAALHDAADAISVPEGAIERILAAARERDARPSGMGRFRRHSDELSDGADDPVDDERLDSPPWYRRPRRLVVVGVAAAVLGIGVVSAVVTHGSSSSGPNLSARSTSNSSMKGLEHRADAPTPFSTSPAPGLTPTALPGAGAPLGSASQGAATTAPSLPTGAVGQSAKVEKTGSVDLTIGRGKLASTLTRLTDLAVATGGFVANTTTQAGGGSSDTPSTGSVTLQVPQASFDAVVAEVQTFGKVTSLTTKGTDVTGQYVDLQARITALQASRGQYLTIMSKASSIGDILAVQNQLDSLQSQIEQLQGQLQVLDSQTTYGTLAVSVSESGTHPAPVPQAPSGISSAWHGAVSGFAAAFDGLVRATGPLLFVILLLAIIGILGRLGWRRVQRRIL